MGVIQSKINAHNDRCYEIHKLLQRYIKGISLDQWETKIQETLPYIKKQFGGIEKIGESFVRDVFMMLIEDRNFIYGLSYNEQETLHDLFTKHNIINDYDDDEIPLFVFTGGRDWVVTISRESKYAHSKYIGVNCDKLCKPGNTDNFYFHLLIDKGLYNTIAKKIVLVVSEEMGLEEPDKFGLKSVTPFKARDAAIVFKSVQKATPEVVLGYIYDQIKVHAQNQTNVMNIRFHSAEINMALQDDELCDEIEYNLYCNGYSAKFYLGKLMSNFLFGKELKVSFSK